VVRFYWWALRCAQLPKSGGPRHRREPSRAAAKEVLELIVTQAERQGAKAMVKDLAEFGGETAVREVFEQVVKESGQEG
jgi:hypothetical protein